jgi:hypothetical protein
LDNLSGGLIQGSPYGFPNRENNLFVFHQECGSLQSP